MTGQSPLAPPSISTGHGPEILVFHGGPGFDHRYLVPHLAFLAEGRTLCFFDENPADIAVTFDDLCRRGAAMLEAKATEGRIEIIAHSFGALVLLGALRLLPALDVHGLLISPVPTNAATFELMRNTLFSRMPPEVLTAMATAPLSRWPAAQVQQMLPYYIAEGTRPELSELSFDFGVYNQVYASLGAFDLGDEVQRCRRCHIIRGSADFITDTMISDWIATCASDTVLPATGHFPFAERPEQFRSLVTKLL